uniref:Uncharacterized protein LOC108949438 n=1 Tax=Phallusia mammillata TaxID=59560 RepID=A0A6F9DK24_9ASCI|nr:uncharacterized protein LOC108949438 [Phallusia mammillata]
MAKKDRKSDAAYVPSQTSGNGPRPKQQYDGGNTSSSVWLIMFLITAGTGAGFYYFFEEMKSANEALLVQLEQVTKELNSVSSFRSEANKMREEISALSSLHKSLKELETKQSELVGSIQTLSKDSKSMQSGLHENSREITALNEKQTETKQFITDIQTQFSDLSGNVKLFSENLDKFQSSQSEQSEKIEIIIEQQSTTNDAVEGLRNKVAQVETKASGEIRDFLAVVDANMEGITNDISRLSAQDQSYEQQNNKLEENLKLVQNKFANLEEKVKQSEDSSLAKHAEAKDLVLKVEEKVSAIQQTGARHMNDLTREVEEIKRSSGGLKQANEDMKNLVKDEVANSVSGVVSELQRFKGTFDILSTRQEGFEESVKSLELKSLTASDVNEMRSEIATLTDQAAKSNEAFLGVKNAIDQSGSSIEAKISTLTGHVRASKDDVSAMRDEVTSMNEAVLRIKAQADQAQAIADNVNADLNALKDQLKQKV